MSVRRYWSWDGDTWHTHDTAEEAQLRCEEALDGYREYSNEGWPEDVESVMWGPIAERTVVRTIATHLPGCRRGDDAECVDGCEIDDPYCNALVEVALEAIPLKESP